MSRISVTLPGGLDDALEGVARRFNSSRGEILRRALAHYLHHIEDLEVGARSRAESSGPDWGTVKTTLREASCPYQDCPFGDACPADVCPL